MRWVLNVILFLTFCADARAAALKIDNAQDYFVLNQFFKMMFTHAEYGYVLEGSKPISQMNIPPLGNLIVPQNINFQIDICAREAIKIWNKICPKQKDFVLKATDIQYQQSYTPVYELLFINVPKLLKEIENNIDLFRYVLGPTIEAEQLVGHIVNSGEPLDSILRGDKVLTGIVLGFGSYNSLMHSRAEKIQNVLLNNDNPPFAPYSNLMGQKGVVQWDDMQLKTLFLSQSGTKASELGEMLFIKPGLGFSNLEEELNAILSRYEKFLTLLAIEKPKFVFGAYKNINNQQLIDNLENSQDRIKALLNRPDFFEYILKKITSETPVVICTLPFSFDALELNAKAEEVIADALWYMSSQLDSETVAEFIKAFCRGAPSEIATGTTHVMPGSLSNLKRARLNLQFADSWFATMPQTKNLNVIAPSYLYFEQMKVGDGKIVDSSDQLLISYVIEDSYGNVLSANHNCWVKLSTTIPGFAHGIQGMREGEIRTLYIHPSLAYGALTTLPPCIVLIAKVTVHQVPQQSKKALPNLKAVDLSWIKDPNFYEKVENASYKMARTFGSRWGAWLNQSSDLDFSKVCDHLKYLSTLEKPAETLDAEAEKDKEYICNRVFWNLISKS